MNLATADLDRLTIADLKNALAIDAPEAQRPPEGLKIDYKLKEPADLADTVAAFANTAGGLLFIGVDSKRLKLNVPIALPGDLFAGGDIKARITDKISSQVTPRPQFDIGVIEITASGALPTAVGFTRAVVVIRVQEGIWPPYESSIGTKVRQPIRILDTTRQATLRDLEQMFERRISTKESAEQRMQVFNLTRPYNPGFITEAVGGREASQPSNAYHTWMVRPLISLRIRLDRNLDRRLMDWFRSDFPDAPYGQFYPSLLTSVSHTIRWQARIIDDTAGPLTCVRWLELTSDGALRVSERIDRHESRVESASDLFLQSLRFWDFARRFYSELGYYGRLTVIHRIDCNEDVIFIPSFPNASGSRYLRNDVLGFYGPEDAHAQGTSSVAREIDGSGKEECLDLVCEMMLAHLRALCQANVDFPALKTLLAELPAVPGLAFSP